MAIARGAGTEIIRSAHFEDIDGSTPLIFGVQHHIYTVLSVIAYPNALNASGDTLDLYILGYDAEAGTSQQAIYLLNQPIASAGDTFVWNDKFSFNGHEPVDFTGPMDSIVKQDAIADQGSAVPQKLMCTSSHASDSFEVTVTFIDQNNA